MSQAKRLAHRRIETSDRGAPSTLPLADNFVHVSPFGRIEGRERYLEIVGYRVAGTDDSPDREAYLVGIVPRDEEPQRDVDRAEPVER